MQRLSDHTCTAEYSCSWNPQCFFVNCNAPVDKKSAKRTFSFSIGKRAWEPCTRISKDCPSDSFANCLCYLISSCLKDFEGLQDPMRAWVTAGCGGIGLPRPHDHRRKTGSAAIDEAFPAPKFGMQSEAKGQKGNKGKKGMNCIKIIRNQIDLNNLKPNPLWLGLNLERDSGMLLDPKLRNSLSWLLTELVPTFPLSSCNRLWRVRRKLSSFRTCSLARSCQYHLLKSKRCVPWLWPMEIHHWSLDVPCDFRIARHLNSTWTHWNGWSKDTKCIKTSLQSLQEFQLQHRSPRKRPEKKWRQTLATENRLRATNWHC